MKIGILTFHWATNHGGILQAYSLQKYLSEAIPDSEVSIIDYWPSRYQKSVKRALHSRHVSAIVNNLKEIKKEKILAPFRSKIKKTYRYYSEKQLKDFPPQVDVLITGSDQIWNEFYTMKGEGGITTAYYLPFQPNARKISYAASFGLVAVKPEMEAVIRPHLEAFDAISVREQTGKAILDKMGISSVVVCDPTLLLKSGDFEDICQGNIKEEYIAKYILRAQTRDTLSIISRIEDAVSDNKKVIDIGLLSVEEWLGAIKNASCLVTNSFHGVVFALKFHTPFFVVTEKGNLNGMNDRFYTLLGVVGLEDRIVSDEDQINDKKSAYIDWESVDSRLDAYSESSKAFLLSNCTESSKKRSINFYRRSECCGCGACSQVCPQNCIEMIADSEGFLYPRINEEKCVHCGRCYDVCHIKNGTDNKENISETFYAKTKDQDTRRKSSSGGIFSEIAKAVLMQDGVVFGAAFSEDRSQVEHIAIESRNELNKLRGSKYVQSRIGNTFIEAKKQLENGKNVLFSGTPCQIRGLKSFLKKDYENLITVEVICHGVPSQKAWETYCKYISEKNKSNVKEAFFRYKEPNWKNFSLKLIFESGSERIGSLTSDPYMQAFLKNLSLRPSCYECVCKETEGVADITLGDAWGIENYCKDLDDNMGTSIVFARSEKGRRAIENISGEILFIRADGYDECLKYNSAMCSSVAMPAERNDFFVAINKGIRFDKITRKYCKTPFIIRAKRIAKKILKAKK